MKRFTSIAAALMTAAFLTAATPASAQDFNVNQRTFLTFSGPVQMPGITLPAGKYVFRLADTALHNVMQVYDGEEKQILGQWFYVPVERTTREQADADGKPVVMFREMPEGMTPAIHYFFYPTDLRGKEFIYPKDQALKIAAATHETVLATDTDVSKGEEAHIFRVEPSGTESQYGANTTASAADNANAGATGTSASSTAPASTAPSYAANDNSNAQTTGTSGAYDQNQNAAPSQQASAELPRTASAIPLIGLLGLLLLAGGCGLRLARARI